MEERVVTIDQSREGTQWRNGNAVYAGISMMKQSGIPRLEYPEEPLLKVSLIHGHARFAGQEKRRSGKYPQKISMQARSRPYPM
jgi:hypothetical protein